MRRNESETWFWIVLIAIGAFMLIVLSLSRWLGADFNTTLWAVIYTCVLLGVAGFLAYVYRPAVLFAVVAVMCVAWPIWLPVLSSIAHGPMPDGFFPYGYEEPWWNTSLFQYGLESLLVAGAVFLGSRWWNDRYY